MNETTLRPIQFSLRTVLVVTAVCAVVCALSILWLTGPTSSAEFSRIATGMSRDEVREIMGEPDEFRPRTENASETWSYRRDWIDFITTDRYSIVFNDQGTV